MLKGLWNQWKTLIWTDVLDSEKVYNIVSKAILTSNILEDVLEHEEMGEKLYTDFIEQQLKGEKSVQKRNFKTI